MNAEQEKYYRKLAQEAGYSEEQTTQLLEMLGNEKIGQGIVPRPEFSRGLDQAAQEAKGYKTRLEKIEKEWLPEAQKAYQTNLAGIERLRQYEQLYGPLDTNSNNRQIREAAEASGLSKEEVERMVSDRLRQSLDSNNAMTLEFLDIREQHKEEFGKRLPVSDFEKFVATQQENGTFRGLTQAYDSFVADDRKTLEEKRIDEEVKRRVDEQLKDYRSTHHIPSDGAPQTEPHLIHDADRLRQEAEKEGPTSGREAFLETMRAADGAWKE